MSNKGYFAASITVVIVSLIMTFVGAGIPKDKISIICLFVGIIMLLHWRKISYK